MKLLTSILVLTASSFAFAYPTLNDIATLEGTSTLKDGQVSPMSDVFTVTNISGTTISVQESITVWDGAFTMSYTMDQREMETPESMNRILANCSLVNGVPETISVRAGIFQTCHIHTKTINSVIDVWVGDVPFQTVQKVEVYNDNGMVDNLSLTSFKSGN